MRLGCVGLAMLVVLGGCRSKEPAPEAQDSLNAIAQDYVKVALALGARDPDSIDYQVAPPAIFTEVDKAYPGYDEIRRQAEALDARLASLKPTTEDDTTRTAFLSGQLRAIETRVGMLRGVNPGFDVEAHLLMGTIRLPDTEADVARRKAIRAQIGGLLPAGLKGSDPAERYASYDQRFLVAGDRLEAVMRAALVACRAATVAHMSLPPGESVDLTFTHNKPWSAFSRYLGNARSRIEINTDLPVTVDDALELACHEGYPGHHVFNSVRDQALRVGKRWPELQVQLTFSPQSYESEAAAAYAPRLAFSLAARTRVERELLFPLAGLKPADADRYVQTSSLVRQLASGEPAILAPYLDERLEFVRAEQALGRETLMNHPEAQLLYVNEYRSYLLAYTDGPRRLAAALPAGDAERWAEYTGRMTRLRPLE